MQCGPWFCAVNEAKPRHSSGKENKQLSTRESGDVISVNCESCVLFKNRTHELIFRSPIQVEHISMLWILVN